jgi:hypothetical protein
VKPVPVVEQVVNVIEPEVWVLGPDCQFLLHFVDIHRAFTLFTFDYLCYLKPDALLPPFASVEGLPRLGYYGGSAVLSGPWPVWEPSHSRQNFPSLEARQFSSSGGWRLPTIPFVLLFGGFPGGDPSSRMQVPT